MKRSILATTAALALAACSGNEASNNVVANQPEPVENVLDIANNTVAAEPEAPPPTTAPSAETPPTRAEAPAVPRRPAPPPRPAPKQEPVDPHAGHDMGNMTNMSR